MPHVQPFQRASRRRRALVSVAAIAFAVTAAANTANASTPDDRGVAVSASAAPGCDPISASLCLLPFPNDYYTVADPGSATGRRVHFTPEQMPHNVDGVAMDPTDWNWSDGFSPGAAVQAFVPGLDVARSRIAPITDIGKSLYANAPVILLDATTGARQPYWAELDTWNSDSATKALVIRPARNFVDGHRYVVALRRMRDAAGHTIAATPAFAALRDGTPTTDAALEARRPALERVFDDLAAKNVDRDNLYLAWDFTVASTQNLTGRMLRMRDDAYQQLGKGVPGFEVSSTDEHPNANVLRRVQGMFAVPKYLTEDGGPGSRLVLGADGLPVRNGTYAAQFRCLIPASAVDSAGRAQPGLAFVYGHGLLGSTSEIEGLAPVIDQYRAVVCATPAIGMSGEDVGNVVNVIGEMSTFGSIPDRLQQAVLNTQFLARLMKDPRGFASDPSFQVGTPAGSAIKTGYVAYNGNSQGGIFGGIATAVSKEWTRAVLGVPGANYSELIPRSVDFDPFFPLLSTAYPDHRMLTPIMALDQMLWDRGEANGYAAHLTRNALPHTPTHDVLLVEAFGDHQVANIGTETLARTAHIPAHRPALQPGRTPDLSPLWHINAVPRSPWSGSALVMWDFGTPAPPIESVPPRAGSDPHGAARREPRAVSQVLQFLQPDGFWSDVCAGAPCTSP